MSERDSRHVPWDLIMAVAAVLALLVAPRLGKQWLRDFGMGLGTGAIIGLVRSGWRARKRKVSESWALTTGKVQSTDVRAVQALLPRWKVEFAYAYQAEGKSYTGKDHQEFASKASAENAAARLRGASIALRYDPKVPDRSLAMQPVAP